MIVRNYAEHWIGCNICDEIVELTTRKIREDTETVLIMMQEMAVDHADCQKFKHDPRNAQLERRWKLAKREATTSA